MSCAYLTVKLVLFFLSVNASLVRSSLDKDDCSSDVIEMNQSPWEPDDFDMSDYPFMRGPFMSRAMYNRIGANFSFTPEEDLVGNVTIRWDFMNISRDSYTANVTIFNYLKKQEAIEGPWELGWTWYEDEILVSTLGAKVSKQSNVLKFGECCKHRVTFVDLPQQTDDDQRIVANCCKGGVIPSWFREADLAKSSSSFQISVGQVGIKFHPPPLDVMLTTQGLIEYVCDSLSEVRNTPGYLNTWLTTCNLYALQILQIHEVHI